MLFQIYAGYGSVFKIYRCQNLPAKIVPFSCEREAYPSNFSPFSKCAGVICVSAWSCISAWGWYTYAFQMPTNANNAEVRGLGHICVSDAK